MNYSPSRALTELLAQHTALRDIMDGCQRFADELDAGGIEPAQMLREVSRLRIAFAAHNRFEEEFLKPILTDMDSFASVRVAQMVTDHVEEHRLMRHGLDNGVTGELRLTLDRLRNHLATEERFFLSSKVLRDDLVTVESAG